MFIAQNYSQDLPDGRYDETTRLISSQVLRSADIAHLSISRMEFPHVLS